MIDVKKTSILLLAMILTAGIFWTQSRLPQLDEKAQSGERNRISAIAFDVIYPVNTEQPFVERVAKTSINWGYTNWKGMTFGILFGAVFLSFLQNLPKRKGSKNRLINSIKGLIGGVPLSVCVNCATPIAQGMQQVGIRLETTLATLMSSPTLNIIVLTMAFTLMPFYFALIKVIASVIFIIGFVPLIVKLCEKYSSPNQPGENLLDNRSTGWLDLSRITGLNEEFCDIPKNSESWLEAISATTINLLKNFVFIVKAALPLMILAGILGATVIEAISFEKLSALETGVLSTVIIALIGTFLPVPIAFDVILAAVLLNSGFPVGLSMTLMFSLGIFSIYPALVIGRNISFQLSGLLFISVVCFSIVLGTFTQFASDEIKASETALLIEKLEIEKDLNRAIILSNAKTECELAANKIKNAKACVQVFLASGLLGDIDTTVCGNLMGIDDPYRDLCIAGAEFKNSKQQALENQSDKACASLKIESAREQCQIEFIKSKSGESSAINRCSSLTNERASMECNIGVITTRIAMYRDKTACNINLSKSQQKECLSALQAMNVSEHGDFNLCMEINEITTRQTCLINVVSRILNNQRDYDVCDEFPESIKTDCDDMVYSARAEASGNPEYCEGIRNGKYVQDQACRIKAVIRKVQMSTSSRQFNAVPESLDFELSETSTSKTANDIDNTQNAKPVIWNKFYSVDNVSIYAADYFSVDPTVSQGKFVKISGEKVGLENPLEFNFLEFSEPFLFGRGVASGDYNNDGWPDLVFPSSSGIHLFQNNGDGTFSKKTIINLNPSLNGLLVSFVDINNDGWSDLFFSAYGGDNYFFINNRGEFKSTNYILLADKDRVITMATGFADWDKDGDLDFILGNWSTGTVRGFLTAYSKNEWVENDNLKFRFALAPELSGETLSVLLSDITGDTNIDMLVANDREVPDMFYLGGQKSYFNAVLPDQGIFPETSFNTMGYESADFNNDLLLDVYSTDMSFDQSGKRVYCEFLVGEIDTGRCNRFLDGYKALQGYDSSWCGELTDGSKRSECLATMVLRIAVRDRNQELCVNIPDGYTTHRNLCKNITREIARNPEIRFSKHHNQTISNKLLMNTEQGVFEDKTEAMKVGRSYWSWNARAADLDNDEWQDIYVANGFEFGKKKRVHSNVFFHNKNGEYFDRAESEFGLEDYINTPSFTYSDIDLDGDIDIITNGVMAGPTLFLNQGSDNNSISFVVRDYIGNRFCIGCKIIIHYDQNNKSQIRELKLSGGFLSFDDPVIYFGLGEFTEVDSIEIIWSTGEQKIINKSFPANRRFQINRLNTG